MNKKIGIVTCLLTLCLFSTEFLLAASCSTSGNLEHLNANKKITLGDLPIFEDYKVKISKAAPQPVQIGSNPKAKKFKTRLLEANRKGINFAGHFIIAQWGCGTSCEQAAIIDSNTGKVYFPDEISKGFGISLGHSEESLDEYGYFEFKPDSKLLIMNGYGSEKYGVRYFVWRNFEFDLVDFIPVKLPD